MLKFDFGVNARAPYVKLNIACYPRLITVGTVPVRRTDHMLEIDGFDSPN